MGTLSYENVQNISKWLLVEEDPACREYMSDILTVLRGLDQEDDIDYFNNYLFRPRVPYGVLFAVGGWSAGSPTNFVETYDSRADKWLFSVDTDTSPRAYHGICTLNGEIYMIGECITINSIIMRTGWCGGFSIFCTANVGLTLR